MKIQMARTLQLAGTRWKGSPWTFHKGRTYKAVYATNQPNWALMNKVFAEKRNGQSILLVAGDYIAR